MLLVVGSFSLLCKSNIKIPNYSLEIKSKQNKTGKNNDLTQEIL